MFWETGAWHVQMISMESYLNIADILPSMNWKWYKMQCIDILYCCTYYSYWGNSCLLSAKMTDQIEFWVNADSEVYPTHFDSPT